MDAVKLANPPIIEMILDIGCDLPPGQDLSALKPRFIEAYREPYPISRSVIAHQHEFAGPLENPSVNHPAVVQGYQFLQNDEKQIVQARTGGFSFNRLAPYSSLDDYLPEIERTWKIFEEIASPVVVGRIQLRFINRITLPANGARLDLEIYFNVCPHLPEQINLIFTGFLNQHVAFDSRTGNNVTILLASQALESDYLPVILDITASKAAQVEPKNWDEIKKIILSLRELKNSVFFNTLTARCIDLFQQPSA